MPEYGIESLDNLVDAFRKLGGVGKKTAMRYAFNILSMPEDDARAFAEAITDAKEKIGSCPVCFNICDTELCPICADESRDRSTICVVEDARAVMAIERVREFRGLYHVLQGSLSPVRGIGPDKLRISELLQRLVPDENNSAVSEIIIATNPDVEGEATAMYLSKLLSDTDIKVTRLANGVPVGGDLEYADELTLYRALEGRRLF